MRQGNVACERELNYCDEISGIAYISGGLFQAQGPGKVNPTLDGPV